MFVREIHECESKFNICTLVHVAYERMSACFSDLECVFLYVALLFYLLGIGLSIELAYYCTCIIMEIRTLYFSKNLNKCVLPNGEGYP